MNFEHCGATLPSFLTRHFFRLGRRLVAQLCDLGLDSVVLAFPFLTPTLVQPLPFSLLLGLPLFPPQRFKSGMLTALFGLRLFAH